MKRFVLVNHQLLKTDHHPRSNFGPVQIGPDNWRAQI